MSIRPATLVSVDTTQCGFTAIQVTPKMDREGNQKQDTVTNLPVWSVDVLRATAEGADVLAVSIAAATKPAVTGPVRFDGLEAGVWTASDRPGGGMWFRAAAVHPAGTRPQN
jgi:hypothetical protein